MYTQLVLLRSIPVFLHLSLIPQAATYWNTSTTKVVKGVHISLHRRSLFQNDNSAQTLHGFHDLLGLVFGYAVLHHLGRALDKLLAVY